MKQKIVLICLDPFATYIYNGIITLLSQLDEDKVKTWWQEQKSIKPYHCDAAYPPPLVEKKLGLSLRLP